MEAPVRGSPPPSTRPRVAEVAWLLEELCRRGISARASGWCLGELRPQELRWDPDSGRLVRVAGGGSARRRALRHLRRGHDEACRALGVPVATIDRLLRYWGGDDAADFLADAVAEAVVEAARPGISRFASARFASPQFASPQFTSPQFASCQFAPWNADGAEEAIVYAIHRRITPLRPPSPMEDEGRRGSEDRGAQMPRFASKRASSSRLFTWPRKRAASAPSIVR